MIHSQECKAGFYQPHSILLQWHITERCNLRCKHCYQETYADKELNLKELENILRQFKKLLGVWRHRTKQPLRGHITVTGGEPFVRQDFPDLLELFAAHQTCFSFAILTNGSFIDAAMARRLHKLEPTFVQVSLEGTQATHDKIRGPGDFERTVKTIKHLKHANIRTLISFTAHRGNFREFPEMARLGWRLRVDRVWADRLVPWGRGSTFHEQVLTPTETREFFELMDQARSKLNRFWRFKRTEIGMRRALQFLVGGGKPYACTAGDSLLTVMPNGDLYPCRRMPIRVGNLMETPLLELYYSSDLFQALRDRNRISDGCQGCFYANLCRGGLKCLAYALRKDLFQADPGCWYATKVAAGSVVSN